MSDSTAARTAMVDCQVRPSDVTKFPIIDALLTIQREEFVPESSRGVAYAGEHLNLGNGRVLLDARTFAKMLEAINIQPTDLVLDIGCGLGYSAAVLAHLAEAVVAVEQDESLATEASAIMSAQSVDNAFVINSPLASGAAKHGPYDAIVIEGAVEQIPSKIAKQLKDGGRIVALFAQDKYCQCRSGIKTADRINWRADFEGDAPILNGFENQSEFTLV